MIALLNHAPKGYETRATKRRRTIVLRDSSAEDSSPEPSVSSSFSSVSYTTTSLKKKLFQDKAPQKKKAKDTDAINSDYLLELDYPRFIQEEDVWFLYEPPSFASVSSQLPRSRFFQVLHHSLICPLLPFLSLFLSPCRFFDVAL